MKVLIIFMHIALMAAVLLWIVRVQIRAGKYLRLLWLALCFKIVMAIAYQLIFSHTYPGGDTLSYFNNAEHLAFWAYRDFPGYWKFLLFNQAPETIWQELSYHEGQFRAVFFVKVVSLVNLATANLYFLSVAWFILLAFVGQWLLFLRINEHFPRLHPVSIPLVFLFFPTLVFWSSGLSKEALFVCTAGLMAHAVIYKKSSAWVQFCIFLLAAWLMWRIKYYHAVLLIPFCLVAFFYIRKKFDSGWRWLGIGAGVLILWLAVSHHHVLDPQLIAKELVRNHDRMIAKSDTGDYIIFEGLEASFASIALHFPKAIFSGLFRPGLWEVDHVLQLLVALERTMILLLTILAFIYWPASIRNGLPTVFWFALGYIILEAGLISLASPNFGSLVRYQTGYLPVALLLLLQIQVIIPWLDRIKKTIRWT